MYVERVMLKGYRNYNSLDTSLSNGLNVLFGDNAQGKTNFLEAIYFCGTGRSHRTHNDKELISFSEANGYIRLTVKKELTETQINVHLKKDAKKGIAIDGTPVSRLGELFGSLLVVMFSPEDLQLIKASPQLRRRFMDMELCQLSKVYYYELQQYYKALNERNSLLKKIRQNKNHMETLFVWDEQLVKYGAKIIKYRQDFINNIDHISSGIHGKITNGKESLSVKYKPNVSSDQFAERLQKTSERDIICGSTSSGVHKDDIDFYINDVNARAYGSQGQQRTAALSVKLAEITIITNKKNTTPVLLLDDVLSELDNSRQQFLLKSIEEIQTLLTCTGQIPAGLTSGVRLFGVTAGTLKETLNETLNETPTRTPAESPSTMNRQQSCKKE